jgi:hypothetical protein
VRAKINDGTSTLQAYGPQVRVDNGGWHHVVVVFQRSTGTRIYVDKAYTRLTTGSVPNSVSNSAPLLIGGATSWYNGLPGDIDEVAVYPVALSATQVAAHYDTALAADTAPPLLSLATPSQGSTVSDTTPAFSGTAGLDPGDSPTVSVKVYSGSVAGGTPVRTASTVRDRAGAWYVDSSPPVYPGTYTATAEQSDANGNVAIRTVTFTVAAPATPAGDPNLLAAGDIADCGSSGDEATANLLDGLSGTIAAVGDTVYENGTDWEYANCYEPSWGRHKARTRPAVGDHEYGTPGAGGYFNYFGAAAGEAGKGYYSYDLGAWHVIVLNGNCSQIGECYAGSPEEQWLRADLAAHPSACTLAYMGFPRFSSGSVHGDEVEMEAFWQALYDYGAEVMLAGDDHDYERFAPQTPSGLLDAERGMTEFVVGIGGRSHYRFPSGIPQANSNARNDDTFGILKLTLHSTSYDWELVPEAGKTYRDFGSRSCH